MAELTNPIKVRWNSDTSSRQKFRRSLKASFDDRNERQPTIGAGFNCMNRQKTNIVIETTVEAASIIYECDQYIAQYGIPTPAGVGTAPYERVRDSVIEELNERGYELHESDVGRPCITGGN